MPRRLLPQLAALAALFAVLFCAMQTSHRIHPPVLPTVRLALLGDVMLGRGIASLYASGGWENALTGLAPILEPADLALANLESPLAESIPTSVTQALAAGEYNLCAPGAAVEALRTAGLDVLSLANNHAQDCTPDGVVESARVLENADLAALPPGETLILERNGIKLALLAFDDVGTPLDIDGAIRAIRAAKQYGAQVIVSLHWGLEYQSSPSARQEALAQEMFNAGAVVVWGHHPHVLQPVAWQRGGHDSPPFAISTLAVYSLGNALFDQFTPPDVRRSAVLLVTLGANGVQSVQAIPILNDPLTGSVKLADEEISQIILRRLKME